MLNEFWSFNLDAWQNLLEECLHHEVTIIKLKAAEAHNDFLIEYYTDLHTGKEARNKVIDRYLGNLRSSNQLVRIGFAQSIGKHYTLFCLISFIALV